MNTTRRIFLKSGALALASVGMTPGFGPHFLRNVVWADEPKRNSRNGGGRKVLVCIFMRGAVDGLSMIVPHGDPAYYQLRQTGGNGIALPRTGAGSVLDLDGHFGLHPALAALKPIFEAGHLAPIHAVGSPNATRSHFDAQDYMESAVPGNKGISTGWLTRTIAACPEDTQNLVKIAQGNPQNQNRIRVVSMTSQIPRSLDGDSDALAIASLDTFGIGTGMGNGNGKKGVRKDDGTIYPHLPTTVTSAMGGKLTPASAGSGFEALYSGAVGDVLHGAGQETFDALKMLGGINPTTYVPANNADYGRTKLGDSLRQIAQLIKADVGLEVAFAEIGGWDTHAAQGNANGNLARRFDELGTAMAGFWRDLGDRMDDVVVLTMSEFGRTARQNGNGGTDHGHGTAFLTMGGNIAGGKVIAEWPGLAPEQLNENRDLAVTTDFRRIFGEMASRHLGVRDLSSVFPEYSISAQDFRGVVKI